MTKPNLVMLLRKIEIADKPKHGLDAVLLEHCLNSIEHFKGNKPEQLRILNSYLDKAYDNGKTDGGKYG